MHMMTQAQAERVVSPGTVSQVSLPANARTLSALSRIDYEDAFIVNADLGLTAEQWARAALEDAPLAVRARLVAGWTALGLRLGAPWSARRVLGWKVQRSGPGFILLSAGGWLGLQGELLFQSGPHGVLFATFVQQN